MRSAEQRRRPAQPNSALRFLLEETGWTQETLARAVTRLGTEAGVRLHYDRTSVAHWLRGSRPEPRVQHLVAEALSRRLARPVPVTELGMGDGRSGGPGRRAAASPPEGREQDWGAKEFASGRPADRLAALTAPVVEPPRTSPPPPAPYRLGLLVPDSPATAVPPPPAPAGRRTGPDEVASVREHTRFFALQADRHGGGHIRTPLAAYLSGLVRQLHAGGEGPHHAHLLAGTARLSYLLARVYADEQRHGLAQRAFLTAAELAEEGNDAVGVAVARRALSSQAHQLGHLRLGLDLAESACGAAPAGTPPSTRAFLYAGLAVTQASGGLRDRAWKTLGRAERELARVPSDMTSCLEPPQGESVGAYQDAALLYQSAHVCGALGDRAGAVQELRASLHARPSGERRTRAVSHAELAELQLSRGRLEEACGAWQEFLDDAALVRSGRVRRARDRMPRLLRPYTRERCVRSLLIRMGAPDGTSDTAHHPTPRM